MSWSGGTYRKGNYLTNGWTGDAAAGIGIEAGRHDTQDDDFASGINACLAKDGSNAATGNLNLNSNKLTSVASGTARTDAPNVGQVQDSSFVYGGTSTGSANAQSITLAPAITAYAAGQRFIFLAGYTNTAAATLNVNGVGTKNIFNADTGVAINGGEIIAGRAYEVLYDGTQFLLLNDATAIQNNAYVWLGTTGGTASAQTASATPAITAYRAGQIFRFIAGNTATGATSLNINGVGAKNIFNAATNAAIGAGELVANFAYQVLYDGTQFLLLNDVTPIQNGDYIWLGTTGGTATAQTASATPAITAYKAGQKFRAKIGASLGSTGTAVTAHTINVNSVGAKNLVNQDGTNPTAGTWVAGAIIELVYDGTNFVIVNDPGGWQTLAPTLSSSMTISGVSNVMVEYRKRGTEVTIIWDISFTLGGVASNLINATPPVNSKIGLTSTGQVAFGTPFVSSGGAGTIGQAYFADATTLRIYKDTSATPANYTLGANTIRIMWTYRSV